MSGMMVGERSGPRSRALLRGCRIVATGVLLLFTACGGDDGEREGSIESASNQPSTETTDLPACGEADRLVVINVFGTVTAPDPGAIAWATDATAEPVARPGAAEVVSAYIGRGYGILYISSLAADTKIGDQAVTEALTVWLGANRFPIGENTRVWARETDEPDQDASIALIEELARLSNAQVQLDAGYASSEEEVFPLVTGGIAPDRIFTLADAALDETSTSLPDEDFEAHLPDVEGLDPVCR